MLRSTFLSLWLLSSLLHAAPNVVLIITDDQGYGDMSCHGNPILKTPNIDRLHAQSVRLSDFHVDPMCAPTRAALMTGRYSARTGVWSTLNGCYIPRRDEITLGHLFSDSGYRTAMIGKWHLGDSYPYSAEHRGFQHVVRHGAGVIGEVPDSWNNDYFDDRYLRNGKTEAFKGFCTDVWFQETIDFIKSSGDQPFFCYLATNAPHGPYNVDDRYAAPYRKAGVPDNRARFYGLIANIDENLGKLMSFLEAEKLDRDTIVIFLGDNGTSTGVSRMKNGSSPEPSATKGYNAGMRGTKTWPYEGGHRNACFVRWPNGGIEGGRDVAGLTAHIDLLPTLVELCGLKKPTSKLDGISLKMPLSDANHSRSDRTLVVQNMQLVKPRKYKDFSVMTDRWRLVKTSKWKQAAPELFDILQDPGQQNDLSGEHPETSRRLMQEYEAWWQEMLPSYATHSPLVVGAEQENPVMLTCHSWKTPSKEMSYSQRHVREGVMINDAYWPIDVDRAGNYRIELRRWPRDADTPLSAPLPAIEQPFTDTLPPGIALPIQSAHLKIGSINQSIKVDRDDKAATFDCHLEKGPVRLESWFTLTGGVTVSSYYIYLTWLD